MADNQLLSPLPQRVASIDALRGFDMFWIMGGGAVLSRLDAVYDHRLIEFIQIQQQHVVWEGFRFEDLIFPLFLFIVGAVLPFSLTRRLEKGHSKSQIHRKIFFRTLILVLLGLMINGFLKFELENFRYTGVLQRIGICYGIGALIVLHTSIRAQVIITAAILILYWAALMFIPVPGFGAGVITAEGRLPSYIDQLILANHIHPQFYGFGDNEGIISHFPAVATVLIGALAGHWLRTGNSPIRKCRRLLLAGIICVIAGYLWGLQFPVVKVIWTSSFVLVAGGWSLLLLGVFYWLIDIKGYKKWTWFFIVIGMNPIAIFIVPRFIDFNFAADYFLGGLLRHTGACEVLLTTLSVFMAKWLFLYFLYRQKIFFRI